MRVVSDDGIHVVVVVVRDVVVVVVVVVLADATDDVDDRVDDPTVGIHALVVGGSIDTTAIPKTQQRTRLSTNTSGRNMLNYSRR